MRAGRPAGASDRSDSLGPLLRSAATALFAIEAAAVVAVVAWGVDRLVADPALGWVILMEGRGRSATAHVSVFRVVVFIGGSAALAAALVLAVRRLRPRPPGTSPKARSVAPLVVIMGANATAAAIALDEVIRLADPGSGGRGAQPPLGPYLWAALFVAGFTIAVCVTVVVLLRLRHRLPLLGWAAAALAGVALVGAEVGIQQVGTSGYTVIGAVEGGGLAAPLASGFTTINVTQHPAVFVDYAVACGSPTTCIVLGRGYARRSMSNLALGTGPLAVVTATTDGGSTWRAWSLSVPETSATPACAASTCFVTTLGRTADIARLSLAPGGTITTRSQRVPHEWSVQSCPAATWCAGIDTGRTGVTGAEVSPPGLIVTADGGRTWRDEPFPPWLSHPGLGSATYGLTCTHVGRCVIAEGAVSPVVATTADGGAGWSRASLPTKDPVVDAGSVQCPEPAHCLALAAPDQRHPASAIIISDDGGATWSRSVGIDPGAKLVCWSRANCLTTGNGSPSAEWTHDGGVTWQAAELPQTRPGTRLLSARAACSGTTCVDLGAIVQDGISDPLSGQPVLLVSHDGGAHWRLHHMPAPRQLPAR